MAGWSNESEEDSDTSSVGMINDFEVRKGMINDFEEVKKGREFGAEERLEKARNTSREENTGYQATFAREGKSVKENYKSTRAFQGTLVTDLDDIIAEEFSENVEGEEGYNDDDIATDGYYHGMPMMKREQQPPIESHRDRHNKRRQVDVRKKNAAAARKGVSRHSKEKRLAAHERKIEKECQTFL